MHYIVKHDGKEHATAETFDEAWTAIHKASYGASVEWLMRWEGWTITERQDDGREVPLTHAGKAK